MRTLTYAFLIALLLAPGSALIAQVPDEDTVQETNIDGPAQELRDTEQYPEDQATDDDYLQDQDTATDDTMADDQAVSDDEYLAGDDQTLPRTASPLALLALLGAAGAGSALGVRALRRR